MSQDRAPAGLATSTESSAALRADLKGVDITSGPRLFIVQFVIIAAFILAWQLLSGNTNRGQGVINEFYIGKPSTMISQVYSWVVTGTLFTNAWVTLQEALLGFFVGTVTAVVLGLLLAVTATGRAVFAPIVIGLYAVPRLGLAPVFLLLFGLGSGSKIALATVVVFFYTFFATYQGAREVDRELIDICRLMKGSRWQIIWRVTLPSTVSWIGLGMKISVPAAFVAALVGEILASNVGLGALMTRAANTFNPSGLLAAALVATIMALLLHAIVARGVDYLLRWQNAGAL